MRKSQISELSPASYNATDFTMQALVRQGPKRSVLVCPACAAAGRALRGIRVERFAAVQTAGSRFAGPRPVVASERCDAQRDQADRSPGADAVEQEYARKQSRDSDQPPLWPARRFHQVRGSQTMVAGWRPLKRLARPRRPRRACSIWPPEWILTAGCPARIQSRARSPRSSLCWRCCRKVTHPQAALSARTCPGSCRS
jgi:hypothetical protein